MRSTSSIAGACCPADRSCRSVSVNKRQRLLQTRRAPALRLFQHPVTPGSKHRRAHPGNALRRATGISRGGIERAKVPRRANAQTNRLHALGLETAHHRADFTQPCLGHDVQHIIQIRFGRAGRTGDHIIGIQRRFITQFIQRQFLDRLAEVTGIKAARQRCQIGHRLGADL